MDYQKILTELEDLVLETYGLWDHNRVGFQWRKYTWNHTKRVRSMGIELGKHENGDLKKLEVAGTLHDITKKYDGEMLSDENGKRLVNSQGLWLNETIPPTRQNSVTKLYHEKDLYRTVHHESGAEITEKILIDYGFDQDFIGAVKAIVFAHLKPRNLSKDELDLLYREIENQILYDADTMDPNVGYTAFFRNIHIRAHFDAKRNGEFELENYVRDLTRFVDSKDNFVDQLLTDSAKEIATNRQTRSRQLFSQMQNELSDLEMNRKYGLLGVIDYFVSETEEPDFAYQLDHLQNDRIPQLQKSIAENEPTQDRRDRANSALDRVIDFTEKLQLEYEGKI